MPQDQEKENSDNSYQRIGVGEFYKITIWAFNLIFKEYPFKTVVWLFTAVSNRLQSLLYTYIFARAVDSLIKTSQTESASLRSLYPFIIVIIIYSIITVILSYINSMVGYEIRQRSRPLLRQKFYLKLNSLGIETLEQPGINDKITRAEEYLQNIMPFLRGTIELIAILINAVILGVLTISFMPFFAPLIILSTVPYIFFDKKIRQESYKFDYENTEARRKAGACAYNLSSVNMLHEIITTGAVKMLDEKFIKYQNWSNDGFIKIARKGRTGGSLYGFLTDLLILYGYVLLFLKLIAKTITVGNVVFWMRSLDMFQRSLSDATQWFNDQFEMSIQLKDTYTLFNAKPAFVDGILNIEKLQRGPKIEFKNVSFKYPRNDSEIFKEFNLTINSGEKLAIVGANGAGKTTLIRLISRFYPVSRGEILFEGKNINEIYSGSLYKNIGVLFQDFNTYPNLTVKENIIIGNTEEPFDEVKMMAAAQTADALGFINEFSNKFDQVLDPRFKGGIKPSTGQWQKLAIARFFYRNSPLVIFDEPTASIDAVSEYHIFNKIYEFFENKTVIIISHRFSTVRNADRIIVLDKGQIIEQGSHKELMALNRKYAEAFKLQAEGYKD